MMSSEINGGGGIVKKLLFPSYADAGRNDTYLPTSSPSSQSVNVAGGESKNANGGGGSNSFHHHINSALIIGGGLAAANNNNNNKASSVVNSEASTVIRDNRSSGIILSSSPPKNKPKSPPPEPPPPHQPQHATPLARSISTTAVVSDFPFDDETAARNPYDDDDASSTPRSRIMVREQQDDNVMMNDDDEGNHAAGRSPAGSSGTASYGGEEEEEEATPAQTAFGKQLLFQRNIVDPKLRLDEDDDDALSTASESGTVIDLANRMNEVEEMILNVADDGEEEDRVTGTPAANQSSPYHHHHHHHDPKLVLAIPTLDEQEPPSAADHRLSNLNQLLRSPKRNDTSAATGQPSTATILSSAMRRFASSPRSNYTGGSSSFHLRSPGSSAYEGAATAQRNVSHRALPLRRINTKVLPMRSCFSFDVVADSEASSAPYFSRTTAPPRGQTTTHRSITTIDRSASWDVGRQQQQRQRTSSITPLQHRHAFTTPTRSTAAATTRASPIHRIEMEREDAIDILSCLVERGISWKPLCPTVPDSSNAEEQKDGDSDNNSIVVQDLVQSLDVPDDRKACLKELVKSHEYALEMKRASKSASVWLQSIGRHSPSKTAANANRVLMDDTTTISTGTNINSAIHVTTTDLTDEETMIMMTTTSPMDLVTAKALLRRAQQEVAERTEQYDRLNDELAQCRAEIGRLNTLNSQFRSNVNRSILDENDDELNDEEEDEALLGRNQVLDEVAEGDLDSSFVRESVQLPNAIESFRAALEEANTVIIKLHAEKGADGLAPVVTVPAVEKEAPPIENSPSNKEEQTINVRMLDAENFETDWDEMVPPLPAGPPEHDLRSPIVAAVLQAWTTDRGLHESLLKWIEQILETDDEVPPLTLSGLDHRVRDGFCLHILPLLLRKPDIHVNVQTRLQRRTTYDLAVTVEPTNTVLDDSAATTTVSSNLIEPSARLSYDEVAEPNIKSPDDEDEREMTGSWTSISGALWGSLKTTSTRRKPANADVEEPYHRVVSAPAGRIGVTFVEYRGHCMVSDVAVDSPLLNWVYPSDVLIAIDEVPVSGMRVRDIIKVLKDRSEKPRALRVVSSHSMSTLTAAH